MFNILDINVFQYNTLKKASIESIHDDHLIILRTLTENSSRIDFRTYSILF